MEEESYLKSVGKAVADQFGGNAYREAKERGDSSFKAALNAAYEFFMPAVYYTQRAERMGKDVTTRKVVAAVSADLLLNFGSFGPFVMAAGSEGLLLGLMTKVANNIWMDNVWRNVGGQNG